jgi:hypothetical protein
VTAQGRHRAQPHDTLLPFMWGDIEIVRTAVTNLEAKGYEVRQVRLTVEDHGHKATVVLHLSPGPVKAWQVGGTKKWYAKNQQYAGQNVGATARRNLSTLLAYVEGLPDVRQADGPVDSPGGGAGVHERPTPGTGEGGA